MFLGEPVEAKTPATRTGARRILRDLFLDQRGEDDGAGNVVRQRELRRGLAETVDHGGENLLWRGVATELVRIGKQVALERRSPGAQVGDQGGLLLLSRRGRRRAKPSPAAWIACAMSKML